MKKILSVMFAALTVAACGTKQQEAAAPKTLVIYYSQTGVTEKMATELQQQLGADVEALVLENPYDGDFQATIARCQQEMEAGELPAIKPLQSKIEEYDQIFICYPVWFGTYASPIASLVNECDFAGKKVVACCTFGSGGLQASAQALKEALPQAEVLEGYGVRAARIDKVAEELNRFLIENGYKAGEVEPLPAYGERHAVTEEEKALFDEACGDYQFPLGTPKEAAVRETEASTDYEFAVESQNMNGEPMMATIFVTKAKAEGVKAEFTQVVR